MAERTYAGIWDSVWTVTGVFYQYLFLWCGVWRWGLCESADGGSQCLADSWTYDGKVDQKRGSSWTGRCRRYRVPLLQRAGAFRSKSESDGKTDA